VDCSLAKLTLGNVLGAIVIILGMLGGVLTYFTTNYKDRAERAEGSATFWARPIPAVLPLTSARLPLRLRSIGFSFQ
jgi:hypothetical protein